MYILGFETTGPIGSVALINLDKCSDSDAAWDSAIKMKTTDEPMSHLKYTMDLAKQLMEEEGITSKDLACIASSIGPGSFTGIRIGVTMARAMAQALDIPGVSVPTLEVFKEFSYDLPDEAVIAGILNARRGQVYGGVYRVNSESDVEVLLPPGPYMLTDVLNVTDKYRRVYFFGDGVDAYRAELENPDFERILAPEEERYQTADKVVRIAARKFLSGDVVKPEDLLPDYMRLSEAEQKLKDGTLKKLREEKLKRFMNQ